MKNYLLLAVTAVFLSVSCGIADTMSSTATTLTSTGTMPGAPVTGGFDTSPRYLQGNIQSVDLAKRKIFVLTEKGPEIEMSVPDNTPITSDAGKSLTLDDLRSGARVSVRYHPLSVQAISIQQLP